MIPEMVALLSSQFVFQYHNSELKIEPLVKARWFYSEILFWNPMFSLIQNFL